MADTSIIKTRIEPYVRSWMEEKFSKKFEDKEIELKLTTLGVHRFDAVSEDRDIVAGIRSNIARTDGRPEGVGKIHGTYAELYFLILVKAKKKFLIFTDKKFYTIFKKKSAGHIPKDTELMFVKLPQNLRRLVRKSHIKSSEEITKRS